MFNRMFEIARGIAALVACFTVLYKINITLANRLTQPASPTTLAILITFVELSCLILAASLCFLIFGPPIGTLRLGIWYSRTETIISMDAQGGGTSRMIREFGFWRTQVSNINDWNIAGLGQCGRGIPEITATGLPNDYHYDTRYKDDGARRIYDVDINPKWVIGWWPRNLILEIQETSGPGQFYRTSDDVPRNSKHPIIQQGFDYFAQRISRPTRKAIFCVKFPPGFVPAKADVDVRFADTEIEAPREAHRARRRLKLGRAENGVYVLIAEVRSPVVGATYFLKWRPPAPNV